MEPRVLADALLIVHFLYVLCVIIPVPLVIAGGIFKWSFVRNSWFRNIHLGMVCVAIVQSILGIVCPWTIWEHKLRFMAGQEGYTGTFISHWVGRLLYYDFEPWIFTTTYIAFGLLTFILYILSPPKCLTSQKRR